MLTVARPSAVYLDYAHRLARLHSLIRAEADDSEAGGTLREEMDGYWARLDTREVEQLRILSVDLYAIGEAALIRDDRPTDQAFRQEMLAAYHEENWPKLHSLLDHARHIAGTDALLFRAMYWAGLRDFDSSLEFLRALVARAEAEREDLEAKQADVEAWLDGIGSSEDRRDRLAFVHELGRAALALIGRAIDEMNDLISKVQSMSGRIGSDGHDVGAWSAFREQFLRVEVCSLALPSHAA